MTDILKPRDHKDVETAVQAARAGARSLEIIGRGTKRTLGRPAQYDLTLDMSALAGVTLYEPQELVLTAMAGTPRADIEALVAANKQELAFEPMDYGALLGWPESRGTVGGMLAANLSGPRRIKAGAARDHFLGVTAVSGHAETFKSGGRVVKNVTGYDLCKLLAGSWGTLAAMTEVTIKVMPRAETEGTALIVGLDDAAAVKAMATAMGSPLDVSAAAHLPPVVAARASTALPARSAVTALRIEGVEPSVVHRMRSLRAMLKPYGVMAALGNKDSRALWRAVRDVEPFAARGPAGERHVWRISTAPTEGAALSRHIARHADAEIFLDWAGGLVWVALAPDALAGAALVRRAIVTSGGHAALVRAPAAARAAIAGVLSQDTALAELSLRVKESFDPAGILGPGRMWAGM